MQIWIQDLESNDASHVRGIGTYVQMMKESISEWGKAYDLTLSKDHPEVVIHPSFSPYAPLTLVKNTKNVVVIHDMIILKHSAAFPAGIRGKWRWFRNQLTLQKFDGILVNSHAVEADVRKMIPSFTKPIGVVSSATKKTFYSTSSEKSTIELPSNFLLYVGDITWNKNLLNMARAIKMTQHTLVLVGKSLGDRTNLDHPWKREFAQFIDFVKNDPQFIFLGYVSDSDLKYIYKKAIAVLLPSFEEGFGYTWLESALSKTPVVLSQTTALEEISKGAAYFVDPHDPSSISNTLASIDEKKNTGLINKAYAIAQEYSQERFVETLAQNLQKII